MVAPGNPKQVELVFGLDEPDDDAALRRAAARKLRTSVEGLGRVRLVRRSLDARRGRVCFRLLVEVGGGEPPAPGLPLPEATTGEPRVVVVGAGPAGMFCAWQLARRGVRCVLVERGKEVQPRRKDLKLVNQRGEVAPDSNYAFGEGGAGTYSDGKLYTRSHKRGDVDDVLGILVHCGAHPDILVDARPHIGSNKLPRVVTGMREVLLAAGVLIRFETRVTSIDVRDGQVAGVVLAGGERIDADAVVIATGHSARDVYRFLHEAGVPLEAKPFALGVRIEHPQGLIDSIQYGRAAGHPRLPAAAYRLAHTDEGEGVYSFCMCPGGFIVPATTEGDAVVVNGMSPSKRNSRFANSGLVASVTPEHAWRRGLEGPLAGLELQRQVEVAAFAAGGGAFRAPATLATDFVRRVSSSRVPGTSYQPGLAAGDLSPVLDLVAEGFADRIRAALLVFDERMRGYLTEDAVLVGVESRTSSPVRVLRDPRSLESPGVAGLYPCAEGAGYAGGIVSAALDGMRVADAIARRRG